jgi:hypothetical protein
MSKPKGFDYIRERRDLFSANRSCIFHLLFAWAFLVRRPLLSVFVELFSFLAERVASSRVYLGESHLLELTMAADLSPAANGVSGAPCLTVGTYDASSKGYGAAYKIGDSQDVLWELASPTKASGFLWKVFRGRRWRPSRSEE